MKKFIAGLICWLSVAIFGACSKPKCPTYMTPQEFAKFEAERMQKGSRLKRDSKGNIKKAKKRPDKFIY
ncbi:hypothetical protein [Raineya orbicola]|jgi:hypothetical protein|uniref:Lipoprotein n=1 Tax=Raineya orbicola TaxID=2016530 RepID=A0A2N3I969_9BACT|nr:hypothetical protein [Raineya orbicola]PKQ66871.1 hypothetical protein Rain11_2259 [Raineya orbicola]